MTMAASAEIGPDEANVHAVTGSRGTGAATLPLRPGPPRVIGQAMYLDAEASGARATGIGCYYDDPVHETLGLDGHAFQSLYHFTVGAPVEDHRLTTQPGYPWENS